MQEKEQDGNLENSNGLELGRLGCATSLEAQGNKSDDILDDFNPVSFFCLHRDKNPRLWLIKVCSSPYFERISILVILVNCVTLGLFDPSDRECETERCRTLERVELAIYVFFLLEMLIKWGAMGLLGKKGYFAETWNRLDCFIVGAGTFELFYQEGQYLSAVRSVRVLRPLRAINRVPSIRILVTLLLDTLPMLGNVLALCFLIFAIFGIVGVQMWRGLLRSRCVLDLPGNLTAAKMNLSSYYIPSFENPDYVCSTTNNGLRTCSGLPPYKNASLGQECSETLDTYIEKTSRSNFTNVCVDWNKYYTKCLPLTKNPSFGAISFDNILIAWVAIFQVITLEGWSDIMYLILDAHGFWNFIYFVILIVVASYFMTNLCLVVIATQFQETKQRESSLMKASRRRHAASNSTIASSRYDQQGCYTQILKYVEHLFRLLHNNTIKNFNLDKRTHEHRKCARRKRKRKKKLVYHHHHHHHHHHHYHHVHCPLHDANFPVSPPNASNVEIDNRGVVKSNMNQESEITGTVLSTSSKEQASVRQGIEFLVNPASDSSLSKSQNGQENNYQNVDPNKLHQVPAISVVTGSSCSLRQDVVNPNNGNMMVKTTASVIVGSESAQTEIATHSLVSAATLSSTSAVASANATTTATLQTACACAVEHFGKDFKTENYEAEFIYEQGDDLPSDWSEDEEDTNHRLTCCDRFRTCCKLIVDSKYFMYVIMGSIFVNTLSMGIEYYGQPQKMTDILEIFNYIFTAIFAVEMFLKLIGHGPYGYIKDPYNLFDGSIVIISLVEMFSEGDSGISVLRSFRLLRVFKLVRFMPALRRQLLVMIHTMDNVMTFLALLAIFIFTASILGMHLFGGYYKFKDENGELVVSRANFDTLFWALVTVFQVLTQEDWNTVMYDGMRARSMWASLYFILLMTIGNYILFNLLVAILVEGFANQPHKSESMVSIRPEEKSRKMTKELVRKTSDSHELQAVVERNEGRKLGDHRQRVCISPTPSVIYINRADSSSEEEKELLSDRKYRRRSSLPILPPKTAACLRSVNHSAPVSPISGSPLVARKSAMFHPSRKSVFPSKTTVSRESPKDNTIVVAGSLLKMSEQTHQSSSFLEKRKDWSLYLFSPTNLFRQVNVKLYQNKWFDRVVLLFILLNCVAMAMDNPALDPHSTKKFAIDIAMYIFLGVFTLEMTIKVVALGLIIGPNTYLHSPWNVMDGILVLVSWVDVIVTMVSDTQSTILGVLRVFRALRTLRPLRVISRAPGLKLVVETLISSLKPIGNIVLIAATFFIIFGILGVQLFKGKFHHCVDASTSTIANKSDCLMNGGRWVNKEYNFDNLAKALLTLFVFSTKDGWVTIMYDGIDAVQPEVQPRRNNNKWNVLYFVAFLLLAGFVVLNMLVGVVVENFQKCRDVLEKTKQEERVKEQILFQQLRSRSVSTERFTPTRKLVHYICTHPYFDLAIAIVIAINILFMALEHYEQPKMLGTVLEIANYFFTGVFILEAILKISALGFKAYFSERWNQLDMMIVILSVAGIILEELSTNHLPVNPTIIRVMRVLRIARVLKLLKTAEGIRKLLDTVAQALPQVGNLGLLFLLMFFIFAALGMELFGKIDCKTTPCEGLDDHAHFKEFGYAMLTLFRISTGDNWNGIMKDTLNKDHCTYDGCEALQHVAPIYFATFVLSTQFVLLNVVVAVLMKHLEDSKAPSSGHRGREEVLIPVIQTEEWEKSKGNKKYSLSVPNIQSLEGRKVSFDDSWYFDEQSQRTFRSQSLGETLPQKMSKLSQAMTSVRNLPPVEIIDHELQTQGKAAGSNQSLRAPIYQMSEDSDLMSSSTSDGDSGPDVGISSPSTSHNCRQNSLTLVATNTQAAPSLNSPRTDHGRKTSTEGCSTGSGFSTKDSGSNKPVPSISLETKAGIGRPTKQSTPRKFTSLTGSKEALPARDSIRDKRQPPGSEQTTRDQGPRDLQGKR